MASTCLVGLGSNLPPRPILLEQALNLLAQTPQLVVLKTSSWRETPPVGGPAGQGVFINAAVLLETTLAPPELLARLKEIERLCGRTPGPRWGPRAADLDLLLYEQETLATPELCLPHPRMAWRRFVLEPAAEIAPEMIHPPTGWTLARLLEHLNTAAPYVAIAGPIAAGKTALAQAVVAQTAARWIPEQIDTDLLSAFYADPAERAWQTELHWLRQRAAQLSRRTIAWPTPSARPVRWTVSDFWFDQSAAFAGVWLPSARQAEYRAEWLAARETVQAPKLTVVLDVPAAELRRRVLARGRPYEQQLALAQLEQIREAILRQTAAADLGPVLRLTSDQGEAVLEEVLAALRGME